MAAGQVTVLDRALPKLANGTLDLDTNTFRVALTTNAQALSASFAGASTDARYADLTAEVVGAGYTAGGELLDVTGWTQAGGIASFTADATLWTALTATMKYAVIYKDGGNDDILAIVDLETTDGTGRTSSGGDFTITWTGSVFTLTRA